MSKTKKQNKVLKGKVDALAYSEANGYPEVGFFKDKKDLQKFYKQLPTEMLEEWAELEGLKYVPCEHEAIHRMRVAMAILYLHFPKETKAKKESPYKKYSTEELIEMAVNNEVAVEPTEDMRIMRMRTIMALRDAGIIE